MTSVIWFILCFLYLLCHCRAFDLADRNASQTLVADTCADPNLAQVWVNIFNPTRTAHVIRSRTTLVIIDTGGDNWQLQSDSFLAWETPQQSTFPIYQLFNPTTQDFIFIVSTNGVAPSAVGFTLEGITGYVYASQICGSVPLLVAAQPTIGDHWYTTSVVEHSVLLTAGWVDGGTAAFVLPLTSGGCGCNSE